MPCVLTSTGGCSKVLFSMDNAHIMLEMAAKCSNYANNSGLCFLFWIMLFEADYAKNYASRILYQCLLPGFKIIELSPPQSEGGGGLKMHGWWPDQVSTDKKKKSLILLRPEAAWVTDRRDVDIDSDTGIGAGARRVGRPTSPPRRRLPPPRAEQSEKGPDQGRVARATQTGLNLGLDQGPVAWAAQPGPDLGLLHPKPA